jgi:hypothetical protein
MSMKRVLASVMILALFASGCTGPFNLTKKVYNFHRSQSDKWADELCFLLVALTPIYGLATFADAIIFNSIEFWGGKNPVEASTQSQSRLAKQGNEKVFMTYNPKTDQVHVAAVGNRGVIFEKTEAAVTAKNDKGDVLYSSVQGKNGEVTIYDGKGQLVKEYPAGQIALLKEKYLE